MSGIEIGREPSNLHIENCRFDNEAEEALEMSREELDRRMREGTPARLARREPWRIKLRRWFK